MLWPYPKTVSSSSLGGAGVDNRDFIAAPKSLAPDAPVHARPVVGGDQLIAEGSSVTASSSTDSCADCHTARTSRSASARSPSSNSTRRGRAVLPRWLAVSRRNSGAPCQRRASPRLHLLWRGKNLGTFRVAELAQRRMTKIRSAMVPEIGPPKSEEAVEFESNFIEKWQAAESQARKELGELYALVEMGEEATVERLMKDLEVQDRLDAMIDKCLKRLLFVRGLKSISNAPASAPRGRITRPLESCVRGRSVALKRCPSGKQPWGARSPSFVASRIHCRDRSVPCPVAYDCRMIVLRRNTRITCIPAKWREDSQATWAHAVNWRRSGRDEAKKDLRCGDRDGKGRFWPARYDLTHP